MKGVQEKEAIMCGVNKNIRPSRSLSGKPRDARHDPRNGLFYLPLTRMIVYSCFMPVCGIVKTPVRGAVNSSMHCCRGSEAKCNNLKNCPRYRG